ncbi:MAG: NTP transferase domain-containing protein [Terrimicrobiaceae bacterium]
MQNHVRHLFLSPGHNYFGHHGQPAGNNPVVEVRELECVAGRGIRGDRFFDFQPDYKGQITFFSWENLLRMWGELGVPPQARDPSATRRNVIVEGVDLSRLIGSEFELQGIRFFGTEECRPCHWMNGAIHPEAEAWMRGRGGLRAKILGDGWLRAEGEPPRCRPVAALVAGGNSTRMGRDKAGIEIAGMPLWQRQLDLLGSVCEHVAVSAMQPPSWKPDRCVFVKDSPLARGPLAGLLGTLEWAASTDASHLLALAVDLPRITPGILHRLLDECRQGRGSVREGPAGFEPLCAVYPVEALALLKDIADAGSFKLQDAVGCLVSHGLLAVQAFAPGEAEAFFNLNSPEDLAKPCKPIQSGLETWNRLPTHL